HGDGGASASCPGVASVRPNANTNGRRLRGTTLPCCGSPCRIRGALQHLGPRGSAIVAGQIEPGRAPACPLARFLAALISRRAIALQHTEKEDHPCGLPDASWSSTRIPGSSPL